MRFIRFALPIFLLLASACAFDPKVPSGGVSCGPARACPDGLACIEAPGFPGGLCCAPGDATCGDRIRGESAGLGGDGGAEDGPPRTDGGAGTGGGCNLLGQSGCPGGQGCHPYCGETAAVTMCEPTGTARRGERCADSKDCAAGLACYFGSCAAGGQIGVCKPACTSDLDCGSGATCQAISCQGMESHRICSTACDPRPGAARTCMAGLACVLLSGDVPDCRCDLGAVEEGASCDAGKRCRAGLICLTELGNQVCRPTCRLDEPTSCGPGRSCAPVPGYRIYGGCSASGPPPEVSRDCDATLVSACGAGQACRLTCTAPGIGRTTCGASPGTRQAGELCTTSADCGPGADCIYMSCFNGTTVGYCERACKTNSDCGSASACVSLTCVGRTSPFRHCLRTCDPVGATSGCPGGLVCTLNSRDVTGCSCRTGGPNVPEGAICAQTAECQPGHLCVDRGGASRCRPICRTGASDCAAGRTCASLPDHRAYGACVPTVGDVPPACDPAEIGSCAAGTACVLRCAGEGLANLACGPVGTVLVGQPCTAVGDCAPGASCQGNTCADGTTRGLCVRRCKTNADCGGGGAFCENSACGGKVIPYGTCTESCDPRGDGTTGCPAGLLCLLGPGDLTDCRCRFATQIGADGAACQRGDDCQPGLSCFLEGASRVCRPVCRLDAPGTCPPGRTCTPAPDQRIHGSCSLPPPP
jgi:hypothetical protein